MCIFLDGLVYFSGSNCLFLENLKDERVLVCNSRAVFLDIVIQERLVCLSR